jgi:hypothetical protein
MSPTPQVKHDDSDVHPNAHIESACNNSNRQGPPPLLSYLATAHPTSIDMGVALARSNEWVSVGFANLYRTHAEP